MEATATAVPSTAAGKQKYKWNDQTVEKLIDLYEERPCLWDISDRSYSKRDAKEKALSEIKDELDIELSIIQAKWKSLRAQYGRELAKENKTKSGQSVDELYESSWAFMQKMRFVDQVTKTAKSTSTLKLTDTSTVDEESDKEDDKMDDSMVSVSNTPNLLKQIKKKRVNINKEKQKLIAKCTDVLDKRKSPKRPLIEDPFALYVSHQLKGLDKTRRLIAEKKINDVIFYTKVQEFGTGAGFSGVNNQQFANPQPVQPLHNPYEVQRGPYTAMLQDYN